MQSAFAHPCGWVCMGCERPSTCLHLHFLSGGWMAEASNTSQSPPSHAPLHQPCAATTLRCKRHTHPPRLQAPAPPHAVAPVRGGPTPTRRTAAAPAAAAGADAGAGARTGVGAAGGLPSPPHPPHKAPRSPTPEGSSPTTCQTRVALGAAAGQQQQQQGAGTSPSQRTGTNNPSSAARVQVGAPPRGCQVRGKQPWINCVPGGSRVT